MIFLTCIRFFALLHKDIVMLSRSFGTAFFLLLKELSTEKLIYPFSAPMPQGIKLLRHQKYAKMLCQSSKVAPHSLPSSKKQRHFVLCSNTHEDFKSSL